MSTTDNNKPSFTNPLQTNNTLIAIAAYAAGAVAQKFPIFDAATWNYIFMSLGGVLFIVLPQIFNRKSAVVSTVANMAEVKNVDLDKTVVGTGALAQATPDNVVVK